MFTCVIVIIRGQPLGLHSEYERMTHVLVSFDALTLVFYGHMFILRILNDGLCFWNACGAISCGWLSI